MNSLKLEALKRDGWCLIECEPQRLEDQALAIARSLGEPVASRRGGALVDRIVPQTADSGHPRSLTSQHGLGSFPLHADTSHWLTPCRYIILACESAGGTERATVLLDTTQEGLTLAELDLLSTEPFRVVNGRSSFYSTVLSNSRPYIRYDSGCMKPTGPLGHATLELFAVERWRDKLSTVRWKAGDMLIVDNWRMLHGRAPASHDGDERVLMRVSVR